MKQRRIIYIHRAYDMHQSHPFICRMPFNRLHLYCKSISCSSWSMSTKCLYFIFYLSHLLWVRCRLLIRSVWSCMCMILILIVMQLKCAPERANRDNVSADARVDVLLKTINFQTSIQSAACICMLIESRYRILHSAQYIMHLAHANARRTGTHTPIRLECYTFLFDNSCDIHAWCIQFASFICRSNCGAFAC